MADDKCKGCKKKCGPKLTLIKNTENPEKVTENGQNPEELEQITETFSDSDFEKAENFKTKKKIDDLEANNFFNSCPMKYDYLPDKPCPHGKVERNEDGKVIKEAECDWYIESERDNYCFWNFIRRKSDPDGNMRPMLQSEIASMFGCSPTKIHFIIKEAMQKLIDNGYLDYLRQLSDNIPDEGEEPINKP